MPETGVTQRHTLRFIREHNARRAVQQKRKEDQLPGNPGRIPRVTKLMALALRFDHLLEQGAVRDQTELAELGHVTRTRVTQIMNLLHLAPDIQEQLLALAHIASGKDPIVERDLRPICTESNWQIQRQLWRHILAEAAIATA